MLDAVRRFKLVAGFVGARRADYAELASLEWALLSRSLLLLVCGCVVAILSLLFFFGFLSLAVVVSAWDSEWRVTTAWLVVLTWLVLCAGGSAVVFVAVRGLHPFERVRRELRKDIVVVRTAL